MLIIVMLLWVLGNELVESLCNQDGSEGETDYEDHALVREGRVIPHFDDACSEVEGSKAAHKDARHEWWVRE